MQPDQPLERRLVVRKAFEQSRNVFPASIGLGQAKLPVDQLDGCFRIGRIEPGEVVFNGRRPALLPGDREVVENPRWVNGASRFQARRGRLWI